MVSRVRLGIEMEKQSIPVMKQLFNEVEYIGGLSPYDFLCMDDDISFGINLKYGTSYFGVSLGNIKRLRNLYPTIIPSLMFFDGEFFYFFVLHGKYSKLPPKEKNDVRKSGKIRTLNVPFEDHEFEELLKAKTDKSWRDFILTLTNLEESRSE